MLHFYCEHSEDRLMVGRIDIYDNYYDAFALHVCESCKNEMEKQKATAIENENKTKI